MDENYEWDAEFALESDILEALQLYRSGDPARPVSTIALRDLERQSECGTPGPPRPSQPCRAVPYPSQGEAIGKRGWQGPLAPTSLGGGPVGG